MTANYYLDMIRHLRQNEEVILHGNVLYIAESETIELIDFLREEYARESWEYPYIIPVFEPEAALWAAKAIYVVAQQMLYRENKETDVVDRIPRYAGVYNASAILSADLCLRFLPDMLMQLELIDKEDVLCELLEVILNEWHYSGIKAKLKPNELNFQPVLESQCLKQLYINRVIETRNYHLAKMPSLEQLVRDNLSIYNNVFWNTFK